jgi:hypothetical protein
LHLSELDWVSEQTRRFQLLSLPLSTRRYKTRATKTVDTQWPFEFSGCENNQ